MSSASSNGPDSNPVPYKNHRSSSAFGSTGIVTRSGTKRFSFWICSIIATVLIVTGVTLMLVGAPQGVSTAVTGTGVIGAVLAAIVFGRERAAAARRRVRHPTAKR